MRFGPLYTTAGPPPMTLTMTTETPTGASFSKPELRELSLRRIGSRPSTTFLYRAQCLVHLFERLSNHELLARCMSLGTSNANESLHAVIWRRARKAVFSSRKTVEIAVAMGVVQFNVGSDMLMSASEAVAPQAASSTQLSSLAVRQDINRLRKADVAATKVETK